MIATNRIIKYKDSINVSKWEWRRSDESDAVLGIVFPFKPVIETQKYFCYICLLHYPQMLNP